MPLPIWVIASVRVNKSLACFDAILFICLLLLKMDANKYSIRMPLFAVCTVGECVCKMGDVVQLTVLYITLHDFMNLYPDRPRLNVLSNLG